LQDEVASAIAKQVESRLAVRSQPRRQRCRQRNRGVRELPAANYYFDNFDLQKSIDYYHQAISSTELRASLRSYGRSLLFSGLLRHGIAQGAGARRRSSQHCRTESERLPEGHGALALAKLHYDWDFAGAEQEFKRALSLTQRRDVRTNMHYLMAMATCRIGGREQARWSWIRSETD